MTYIFAGFSVLVCLSALVSFSGDERLEGGVGAPPKKFSRILLGPDTEAARLRLDLTVPDRRGGPAS